MWAHSFPTEFCPLLTSEKNHGKPSCKIIKIVLTLAENVGLMKEPD